MILARFDEDEGVLSMHITGHAFAAPEGEDVVCAGASTLAYTVAQCVMELHERGELTESPSIEIVSGSMMVRCSAKAEHREKAETVFRTAETGFLILQDCYPDKVRVISLQTVADED